MDDAEAVRRVLAGDDGAFRVLVERHGNGLHRFCRARLGNDADAEDAVQDVLVRAFRSLGRYDPGRSFAAWLFAIAANRVKTRYRARFMELRLAERAQAERSAEEPVLALESGVEFQALDRMAAEELRAAVGTLAADRRVPVELYYFAGLSVAETAAALGLGTEAVKSRLFRARKELASILGETGQPTEPMKGRS